MTNTSGLMHQIVLAAAQFARSKILNKLFGIFQFHLNTDRAVYEVEDGDRQ